MHWAWVLGPALFVAFGALLWDPLRPTTRGTLGILAGASVFLVIQIYQVITHTGYGDPRYFVTSILFATIAVAWLASTRPSALTGARNLALIGLLIIGGVTGPRALTSGRITDIEGECHFFDYGAARVLPFLGRPIRMTPCNYCGQQPNLLAAWQKLDATLDRTLKPNDRVLADNFSNFYTVDFTRKADQFVVRNDRDWQKIVANPDGAIDYIVTTGGVGRGGINVLPHANEDAGKAIIIGSPHSWKLVAAFPGGAAVAASDATPELFKYVGTPASG